MPPRTASPATTPPYFAWDASETVDLMIYPTRGQFYDTQTIRISTSPNHVRIFNPKATRNVSANRSTCTKRVLQDDYPANSIRQLSAVISLFPCTIPAAAPQKITPHPNNTRVDEAHMQGKASHRTAPTTQITYTVESNSYARKQKKKAQQNIITQPSLLY